MSQPDSINLTRLAYDSAKQNLQFGITAWKDGSLFTVAGRLTMATPGDLPESQIRELGKQHVVAVLRELADNVV